jgi:hypothetical protein
MDIQEQIRKEQLSLDLTTMPNDIRARRQAFIDTLEALNKVYEAALAMTEDDGKVSVLIKNIEDAIAEVEAL